MTNDYQLDLFETEKRDKIDELLYLTGRYRNSNEFYELMEFCAKFRTLSPYNAMLVQMQRPGARYVLSASAWDKKYNTKIKLNARPLIILVPFGPVDYVFDIDETDITNKKSFLESLTDPFKTKGSIEDKIYKNLVDNLKFLGIRLESVQFGSQQNAEIRFCKEVKTIEYEFSVNKKFYKNIKLPQYYQISVSNKNNTTDNFASIIHELGHFFCEHLITPNNKWWNPRNLSHSIKEFEAEAIAWLICERVGIINPSEKYLAGYIKQNAEIPNISIDLILKAVNQIEMLFVPISISKSFLSKNDEYVKNQLKSN